MLKYVKEFYEKYREGISMLLAFIGIISICGTAIFVVEHYNLIPHYTCEKIVIGPTGGHYCYGAKMVK